MKTQRKTTSLPDYSGFYNVIAPLIMGEGVGDGKTTACIMAQAATIDALRKGKTLDAPTDALQCACPILRRMAIRANDTSWWASNEERTEHLRPLIPLLLDSRVSEKVGWKRLFHTVDRVVRTLTPMRLDFITARSKDEKLKAANALGAKTLRKLPRIKSKADCKAAREILLKFKRDASAYADAYAYAYADAYAYASAYADAYAYASAYADAYAYASADEKREYRTAYLELFREVAAIRK